MLCKQCRTEIPAGTNMCPVCKTPVPRNIPGFEYTNGVKQSLKSLVDNYGTDILSDTTKFISFLNDYLPEYEKERRLIRNVMSNGVIKNMLAENNHDIAIMKAKEYMTNELFLSENASEFIIECFAFVLGWVYVPAPISENVSVPSAEQSAPASAPEPADLVMPSNPKEFKPFDAFKYKLKRNVEIPFGYTSLASFCFDSFGFIRAVKIPESVITIGEYAFSECKKLKTVELPSSLRIIKRAVFSSCISLNSIKIPEGVTAIEEGMFSFCRNLEIVELPSSISSIGNEAFSGCESLRELFIPENVKFIGEDVFTFCPKLTIKCYENSYVHKYCANSGLNFTTVKKSY
ncbi:MAG: leucine-rich repeat domain-containing protein [Ruminococcus sp.]|nr:leucine-rich repeat domain-containing protein [Ruminococcus sp.]